MWYRRRNIYGETRLVTEWLMDNYPGRAWTQQYPVGTDPDLGHFDIDDPGERRAIRNRNQRVDAFIEPAAGPLPRVIPGSRQWWKGWTADWSNAVVLEGTMWRAAEALGKLQSYMVQLPATPAYQELGSPPVVPILLTGQRDPVAELLAGRVGVRYVWWEPPWIEDFYAAYPGRRAKPLHPGIVMTAADLLKTG